MRVTNSEMMKGDEARALLGIPPTSRPTPSQVKAAYKRKAWEFHPDRFPTHEKAHAESKFKMISEAYSFLHSGFGEESVGQFAIWTLKAAMQLGLALRKVFQNIRPAKYKMGRFNARAYQRQKEAYPSNNPFLP
ncbi:hypothetical protein HHK36_020955 [Tetracentron sinense]|uniref:J domain-containing protein n=1 Tax=Tetracentron sinense TaxID=13715 RepID=A0A835D8V6_TETSI|nr:hypothetical protein HHK36_020955 [Tetracentron sinense]